MGFFDFLSGPSMEQGLEHFRSTPGSILLDVRTPEEYQSGYIPGSVNLPLHTLKQAETLIPPKDTPLFVYCQSGLRSKRAARLLTAMGYQSVEDLGGIAQYRGPIVK